MVTSTNRGNPIEYQNGVWIYSDDKTPLEGHERPCTRCGSMPTMEGYDACLGHVKGATSACCGHGVGKKILIYRKANI